MQGKRHKPSDEDRRLVKTLSAVGVRYVDIADKLQIDHDTLTKHYKQELTEGRMEANAAVAQTLFQQAKAGNTAAMIFWLKTRAGWREHNVVEHANSEGGIHSLRSIRRWRITASRW
jgi:uncharacterized protein YjcR